MSKKEISELSEEEILELAEKIKEKNSESEDDGTKLKERLGEEVEKQVREWYKKTDKKLGENGLETQFFTFLEDVKLEDDRIIEEGETVELPAELESKFETKVANDQIAAVEMYECPGCGERARHSEPCPNPNCKHKNLRALHPTGHDEIGNALMENYFIKTMNETEKIYYFDGRNRFKKEGAEMIIKGKVKEIVPSCKSHLQNEVVRHVRTSTNMPEKYFGLPKEKIAVENGVLDLVEGEREELDPREETPLARIPVKHDPDADCPKIKKFVSEVVREEDIPVIQEMFGYCLWKDYPFAKAFMLLGSGANGKSTLLNLLQKFLGNENTTPMSLQELCNDKFVRTRLYGKLANIHADLPDKKVENPGVFKMITGQDEIEGNVKHVQEAFNFYNHAKILFSANELPKTDDRTDAFFRRWIIIEFPNHFPEDDPNTDPHILDKLTTEKEMSGLLNWALEGLQRLLENEEFSFTESREEVKEKWFLKSDSLRAFVSRCLEKDPNGFIPKKDLQKIYESFCEKYDIYTEQKGQVTRRLPSILPGIKGGTDDWYRPKINGERPRCWKGVRLKEDVVERDYVQNVQDNLTIKVNNKDKNNFITLNNCKTSDKSDILENFSNASESNTQQNPKETDFYKESGRSQKEKIDAMLDILHDEVGKGEEIEVSALRRMAVEEGLVGEKETGGFFPLFLKKARKEWGLIAINDGKVEVS